MREASFGVLLFHHLLHMFTILCLYLEAKKGEMDGENI
jgi:hypothetical protein